MDPLELAFGVIGSLSGLGALAWNVVRWRGDRPRAKPEAHFGRIVKASSGEEFLHTSADGQYSGVGQFGDEKFCISCANVGKRPLTVTGVGLWPSSKKAHLLWIPEQPGSLPKRLSEGEKVDFWIPLSNVLKNQTLENLKQIQGPYCTDATGRIYYGKLSEKTRRALEQRLGEEGSHSVKVI